MTADEAAGRAALNFSALDPNGDDIIDTDEWSNRSTRISRNEDWVQAEFDSLDENSSGSISPDEYRSASARMLDGMSTGSTDASDTGASDTMSGSDEGNSAQDGQSGSTGVPVFIYRFSFI